MSRFTNIERRVLKRLLSCAQARGESFGLKQQLAGDGRYYGDGGTIHGTGHLDVETFRGTVVSVWFRCSMLRFEQHEVDERRADSMEACRPSAPITSVEFG